MIMKNLKIAFIALAFLSFAGCDTDISINTISVDLEDETVRTGENLEVKVKARDTEGIESILIKVPILDTEAIIDNGPDDNRWTVSRKFLITDDVDRGTFLVEVIVTDEDGNEETEFENFTIK